MPRLESHQGSLSKPGIEDQHRYTTLMKKARQAAEEGHPRLSLEHLNKAAKIYNSEKVQKRIMKIEVNRTLFNDEKFQTFIFTKLLYL